MRELSHEAMPQSDTRPDKGHNGTAVTTAKLAVEPTIYSVAEATETCLEYFNQDELAASSVVTKYLLRSRAGDYLERSPADMHRRLAGEFGRIEARFGGDRSISADGVFDLIEGFKRIIPQGSPMYGIGNNESIVSLSNCVVVAPPEDDISSIVNRGKDLANLFKRRCGVGIDISPLRPEGMSVSNSAGTTTGAWSFADFYSYICRMIGQNGRRGALMITIDVRHPDVEQFITMKSDLSKVTGANVSIKIRDDFMEAVEADEEYVLRWPVDSEDPVYSKTVRAREVWDKLVAEATENAEPGLMMWDNILSELPAQCYADVGFNTVTTNPCGEIPLSPYDSCRLIAINLTGYVRNAYTDEAYFDFDAFDTDVRAAQRMSDDLVELESEKLRAILKKVDTEDERELWTKMLHACDQGRRTGLGTLALGDALAQLKLVYATPEAIEMTSRIYEAFKVSAYWESVELAKERGPFPVFDWEKEKNCPFIMRLPLELREAMAIHGRRNISLLTNAPTGTTSICAQTSSGIEPIYRLGYKRRKKISDSDRDVTVDHVDDMGDRWQEFAVYHHALQQYAELTGYTIEFDDKGNVVNAPEFFISSDKIDWEGRVDMQAAIQRHIDHSISSTINLPRGTAPEVVDTVYRRSWKVGLKGVTVYVDGSRDGPLITNDEEEGDKDQIRYQNAPRRPEELPCEIHHRQIRGVPWTILVGLLHGKPYEIFAGPAENIEIPDKYTLGTLIKNSRKTVNARYDLRYGENGGETTIKNIVKWFEDSADYGTMCRMVSINLRHGVPTQYLVEQLLKEPNDDLWSFNRVMARVLKKWIPDGTNRGKPCPSCGDEGGLVYQEGCLSCSSCGHAKCG